MFRSARQDPRDHAALLILLHGYCSCNEHNEVFTAYSNRHVGEFQQLLLGGARYSSHYCSFLNILPVSGHILLSLTWSLVGTLIFIFLNLRTKCLHRDFASFPFHSCETLNFRTIINWRCGETSASAELNKPLLSLMSHFSIIKYKHRLSPTILLFHFLHKRTCIPKSIQKIRDLLLQQSSHQHL